MSCTSNRSLDLLGIPSLPTAAFSTVGVNRLMRLHGGDGGSSDSSDSSTCDISYGGFVTDSYGGVVTDGYGNPVSYGGCIGGYVGGDGGPAGIPIAPLIPFGPNSGVYTGSLSSLGNMVAMCVSTGGPAYKVVTPGTTIEWGYLNAGDILSSEKLANTTGSISVTVDPIPYSTGYFRDYWSDPTKCVFGANSVMPALTGVMPEKFTTMQGNFVYYVDLQLQRLSGSNTWNDKYFMSAFNQAVGWVVTSNNYLASLNVAQNTNFGYYGATDYSSLTTQGFNVYKQGQALRQSLRNLGLTVSTISDGHFGTPNAVAKSIIDNGIGSINNFSQNIYKQGVIYGDIYNENYTGAIASELAKITNIADLAIIQSVLESSIPNITSALDYTSLPKSAGLSNDSAFATLADFGKDIYKKAPDLQVSNGQGLAAIIDLVQNEVTANVNAIAGNIVATGTSTANTATLLNQEIIDSLKTYLPVSDTGGPISVINVVGAASGYMTDAMLAVNEGISRLYATDYGIRIRDILTDISRYYSGYPLTTAEQLLTPENWQSMLEAKKTEYYQVLNEVAADRTGDLPDIVKQINENYEFCCQNLYLEHQNWSKANFVIDTTDDTSQYFSFVSTVPVYAIDIDNIGTDYLLYGLCQNNQAGDIAKVVLAEAKTNFILANAGVQITGIL